MRTLRSLLLLGERFLVLAVLVACLAATPALANAFGGGANSFSIDFVTIGDPGNLSDTTGAPGGIATVCVSHRQV
jgi:hypothetical protein